MSKKTPTSDRLAAEELASVNALRQENDRRRRRSIGAAVIWTVAVAGLAYAFIQCGGIL